MGPSAGNLDEIIISQATQLASREVWRAFWTHERRLIHVDAKPNQKEFWDFIADLVAKMDLPVILLLPDRRLRRVLREWAYRPDIRPPNLRYEKRSAAAANQYIATVEGIDVYFADLKSNRPTLLPSGALRTIVYRPVGTEDGIADLEFTPEEDPWKVTLRIKISQSVRWNEFEILELAIPVTEARASDSTR